MSPDILLGRRDRFRGLPAFILGVLLLALWPATADAQATRTWVSGVGDDANPCSRTAPCKTYAGAISKTAAGGQISVLDPGGYGAVTITKSISIVGDPALGGILNSFTSGVVVNAGPNDVVALHGLFIDGGGSGGTNGIRFVGGKSLHVENCIIRNQTLGATTGFGIDVEKTTAGTANLFVTNTDISRNTVGLRAKVTGDGVVRVTLDRVTIEGNSGAGIRADGFEAAIRISNSTVAFNAPGLQSLNTGRIISFGNNALAGNVPDGAPTSTQPLK